MTIPDEKFYAPLVARADTASQSCAEERRRDAFVLVLKDMLERGRAGAEGAGVRLQPGVPLSQQRRP